MTRHSLPDGPSACRDASPQRTCRSRVGANTPQDAAPRRRAPPGARSQQTRALRKTWTGYHWMPIGLDCSGSLAAVYEVCSQAVAASELGSP
jgi:hypothetical protein